MTKKHFIELADAIKSADKPVILVPGNHDAPAERMASVLKYDGTPFRPAEVVEAVLTREEDTP